MGENVHKIHQHELDVAEVMKVHREYVVFPSIYPCSEFMSAAGILQDFQTLISNAGLEHFVEDEPPNILNLLCLWCRISDLIGPHLSLRFTTKFTIKL